MNLNQKFKLATLITAFLVFIMFICSMSNKQNSVGTIVNEIIKVCPDMAYKHFGDDCINHLDERYPGKLNESGDSQVMPELIGETSHDRFKQLAEKYGLDASLFWKIENKYGIREGVILGIVIAETSGGKNGSYVNEGCYNLGNVGNNDRGDRYCFEYEESIDKIGKTLSNKYLGTTQTLGCLSKAGSCSWWENKGHIYASSDGNWERTMVNVLNAIYSQELGDIEPTRFNIRKTFTIYQ